MAKTDEYGFDHLLYFKREGNHFPVPFIMRKFSRVGFLCRHAMMCSHLLIFISPLFYGTVTIGRFLFVFLFVIAILFGIYFEERELKREMGKNYEAFKKIIPSLIIPNIFIFFTDNAEFQKKIEESKRLIK